jgi:PhzF family phenazine biosynthesis protein
MSSPIVGMPVILPIFHVDAFADRPFSGNPAAVCPLDGPLPASLMQDIAAQNNLSETAFFHREGDQVDGAGGAIYNLRWFTPAVEVDLCGHATLASAFVLMTQLEPSRTQVSFRTRSGLLVVRRRRDLFELDFPAFPPAPPRQPTAAVAAALGVAPGEILRARAWLAVYPDASTVRGLAPDMAALARLDTTVCVTAPAGGDAGDLDFVCRYFAPTAGIAEDPVTGSAFCTLIPFWADRLGKPRLRARQVSRRGGEVFCELAPDARVLIAGRARLVVQGSFYC